MLLTARTVQAMEQDKTMLPAEALRRAMLEFVSAPKSADYPYEDYAYPGVWASFMVVGFAHPAR